MPNISCEGHWGKFSRKIAIGIYVKEMNVTIEEITLH